MKTTKKFLIFSLVAILSLILLTPPVSAQTIGSRKTVRIPLYVMNDGRSWMSISNPRYRVDDGWAVDTRLANPISIEVRATHGRVSGPTFSVIDKGDSGFNIYSFSGLQSQSVGVQIAAVKVNVDAATQEASSIQHAYSAGGRTVLFEGSAAAAYDNTPSILGGPYRTARGHINATGVINLVYVGSANYWRQRYNTLAAEIENAKNKQQQATAVTFPQASQPSIPDAPTGTYQNNSWNVILTEIFTGAQAANIKVIQLSRMGWPTYSTSENGIFRVYVGPYENEKQAKVSALALGLQKFPGVAIAPANFTGKNQTTPTSVSGTVASTASVDTSSSSYATPRTVWVKNESGEKIWLAVHFKGRENAWITRCWWVLEPGSTQCIINEDDGGVESRIFIHAHTATETRSWGQPEYKWADPKNASNIRPFFPWDLANKSRDTISIGL